MDAKEVQRFVDQVVNRLQKYVDEITAPYDQAIGALQSAVEDLYKKPRQRTDDDLRHLFASSAMKGLLDSHSVQIEDLDTEQFAESLVVASYQLADKMIEIGLDPDWKAGTPINGNQKDG